MKKGLRTIFILSLVLSLVSIDTLTYAASDQNETEQEPDIIDQSRAQREKLQQSINNARAVLDSSSSSGSTHDKSICNGEQVAGFRDIKTGRFEEILYIRKPSDIESFMAEYGIEGEIRKEY